MNYRKRATKLANHLLSSYEASKSQEGEIHAELERVKRLSIDSYHDSQHSIEKIRASIQRTKL